MIRILMIFFPFFLLAGTVIHAHGGVVSVRGLVSDANGVALQYVNVGVVGTDIGTVTNAGGRFELVVHCAQIENNNTLRFSMVGFEPKAIAMDSVFANGSLQECWVEVVLIERVTSLDEVVFVGKRPEVKTKGTEGLSLLNMMVNLAISDRPNQNLGSEIGRLFRVGRNPARVNSVRFYVLENNYDTVTIRLNIYNVSGGRPFNNLLRESILVELIGIHKGWVEVDLKTYGIVVSRSVVFSLEWVGKSERGTTLAFPIVMPIMATHYYKFGSQNRWKRFHSMSTLMELNLTYASN